MYRGLSYARKSEAIFFTLDDVRLLRDFAEVSFTLDSSEKDRRKDLRLFDLIIPLLVGSSLQRARREVQTPPLCEFRLAGYFRLV